jgi:hypothetical protein
MSMFKSLRNPTLALGALLFLCTSQQVACVASAGDEEAASGEETADGKLDANGVKLAEDLRALSTGLDHTVQSFERPAGIAGHTVAASAESRAVLGIETWKVYQMPSSASAAELVDVEGFSATAQAPLLAFRLSGDGAQRDTAYRFDGKEYQLAAAPASGQPPVIGAVQALWDFETRKGARESLSTPAKAAASPWCAVYTAKFHVSVYSAIGTCGAAAAEEFLNPAADGFCLLSLYTIASDSDNIIKYCGRNPPALPSILIMPGSYKKSCNLGVYRYRTSGGKLQVESSCKRKWPRTDSIVSRTALTVKCLPVYGDLANCDGQLKCGKCN